MEILRPDRLQEFLEIFEKYSNSGHCYYRGQADFNWDISPGLSRNKTLEGKIEAIRNVEAKIIGLFEKRIEGSKLSKLLTHFPGCDYHHTWILLMAAQHYGLPTRLLDFSHDKFVALEFAAADLNYLDKDAALIIYKNNSIINEEIGSSVLRSPFNSDLDKTFFFQAISFWSKEGPPLSEHRKPIQGSKFLYRNNSNIHMCLSEQPEHSNNLIKIQISKKIKPELIDYLIGDDKIAYDLYSGKDENDFHAAIIKQEFKELNQENIDAFIKKT